MSSLTYWVITLSVLAVSVALIVTLLEIRRVARQAASMLSRIEPEIQPLVTAVQDLVEEVRGLSKQVNRELGRLGEVTDQIQLITERVGRLVGLIGSVGRVGKIVGLASGVKKGLDVFVSRLTKNRSY